ncbi:MAG: transglutaminase [Rhodocyclaceae bacterium]|nr:transglutaminase [Rhodocyclaceae bacterium]
MIHTPPGAWPEPGPEYLASARFIDSGAESIRRFAQETAAGATSDIEEPYVASNVLQAKAAYCLPKAILLAAAARAVGIHAAIGLSDVENHLTTEKLKAMMGGKTLFMHHGYAVLYLDGKWVKAAPAFNIEMCEKFHVHPTEFDGTDNAIFQEYDMKNRRHMEYVRDHGCWSDFPFEKVMADFRAFYPAEAYKSFNPGELFEDGVRIS